MYVDPYIFFDGRCEEALDFYRKALNAEVAMMLRMKENPEPHAGHNPSENGEKILHAAFKVGQTDLMASDGYASGKPELKGITLSLAPATEAEA